MQQTPALYNTQNPYSTTAVIKGTAIMGGQKSKMEGYLGLEPDPDRTDNLLDLPEFWNQMRYHCATAMVQLASDCCVIAGFRVDSRPKLLKSN